MPKVSIGVAIYNSEKYLRECIESLINQTLQDIEIILVSDASPDNSIMIMKEYAEKYPEKVRIFEHKENKRAGGARNTAIRMATGDYFGYVDADDFVDYTMFEKLYNATISNHIDAAQCWVCDFDDGTHQMTKRKYGGGFTRIFKREIVINNDLFYPENIMYEDNYFGQLLKRYINGCVIIEESLYYQRQQNGSIRHNTTTNSLHDRLKVEELLVDEFQRRKLEMNDEFEAEIVKTYVVNSYYLFALTKKCDFHLISFYVKSCHLFVSKFFPRCVSNRKLKDSIKPWELVLPWSAIHLPGMLWLLTFTCTTALKLMRYIKREIIKK